MHLNPSNPIFVVTLSRHRIFGLLFYPYFAEQIAGEPFLRLIRRVRGRDLKESGGQFATDQTKIVKQAEKYSDESLMQKFSPNKPVKDLTALVAREEIKTKLLNYIESAVAEILEILKYGTLPVYQRREKYANLYVEDLIDLCFKDTRTVFNFVKGEGETRYFLTLRNEGETISLLKRNIEILVNEPCRIYYQNKIYFFDELSATKLMPFKEKEYISIPEKMEERYYESFILNAIKSHEVKHSGFEIRESTPVKQAILSLERDLNLQPLFVLNFTYNGVPLRMKQGELRVVHLRKEEGQFVFDLFARDAEWEEKQLSHLHDLGLTGEANCLKMTDGFVEETDIYHAIAWLTNYQAQLQQAGILISQDSLQNPYYLGTHTMQIAVSNKIDWFDLEITVEIGEWRIPFLRLKRLILGGIREYKLPNGELFILPEAWFSQFSEILSLGKTEAQKLILKPFHWMLLSQPVLAGQPELQERLLKLYGHQPEYQEVPAEVNGQLRNYQQEGYNWLIHLWQNGMNGCLADDMGLGKTLQTLVLLTKLRRKRSDDYFFPTDGVGQLSLFQEEAGGSEVIQPASLIVLPVSLLHNWENEIRRFAPALKVFVYSGVKRREKVDLRRLNHYYDIILTTYGTVRNDSEVLAKHSFFYLILDESQNIKNAESKTYRAVASIPSQFRLSLTGTPIENSLSDLWSQMNFLNPGHLGNFKFFKERYLLPIEKEQDKEASNRLNRLIDPFILRRTKEQVAADLPPVMEEMLSISMTPEQQELYEAEKSSVRNYLLQNIDVMEPRNTTFVVLQALTKLRQIAIHPRMIDPGSLIESGKFNEILSMLEVLVAEKHKILIFSSFVKHLNLLEEVLLEREWGFCRLTGQTIDRKSVISDFQSDDRKNIFLISLKAGGVGLNLTAADYIFIIDPWWNPAAEMQAISRAHRIGQEKKVFVYRFISEQSIEEKIQQLQEKKAALASEFIRVKDPIAFVGKEELIKLFE